MDKIRNKLLRLDALFIGITGAVQMMMEIAGHFKQTGIYSDIFARSPYTIGFFEAHGLAMLIALLVLTSKGTRNQFWHRVMLIVHLFLGGANVLFWHSFVVFDLIIPGTIATIFHGCFAIGNFYVVYTASPAQFTHK